MVKVLRGECGKRKMRQHWKSSIHWKLVEYALCLLLNTLFFNTGCLNPFSNCISTETTKDLRKGLTWLMRSLSLPPSHSVHHSLCRNPLYWLSPHTLLHSLISTTYYPPDLSLCVLALITHLPQLNSIPLLFSPPSVLIWHTCCVPSPVFKSVHVLTSTQRSQTLQWEQRGGL